MNAPYEPADQPMFEGDWERPFAPGDLVHVSTLVGGFEAKVLEPARDGRVRVQFTAVENDTVMSVEVGLVSHR